MGRVLVWLLVRAWVWIRTWLGAQVVLWLSFCLEILLGRFLAPPAPESAHNIGAYVVTATGSQSYWKWCLDVFWHRCSRKCTQYWYLCRDRRGQPGLLEMVLGRFLAPLPPKSAPNIGTYVVTATGSWGCWKLCLDVFWHRRPLKVHPILVPMS